MKRTVEIVLIIIGMFVYFIGAVFGGAFIALEGNQELLNDLLMESQQMMTEEELRVMDMLYSSIGTIGWVIVVTAVTCIILGVIAAFMFKGNKKPKPAGIILIVAGGLTTLLTAGSGIFAGIFYIISGIMGLARKERQEVTLDEY
ncbi:DUF4064 domain-containing protein [Gracilibacillus xinjiangensis]|uniref:DUF4064 domain-containing protein n=1 Tax=Gracilibacillus xinjiangensis TaxID=1193282 RepID=A0ABV8WQE7_9BACI